MPITHNQLGQMAWLPGPIRVNGARPPSSSPRSLLSSPLLQLSCLPPLLSYKTNHLASPSPPLLSLSRCSRKARAAETPPPNQPRAPRLASSSSSRTADGGGRTAPLHSAGRTGEQERGRRRGEPANLCAAGRHGEVPVLRAGAHQQGRLDQGGGPATHRLHQGPRRGLLEVAPQSRRAATVREELPAAVDQLPAPRPQARQLHRGGGRAHHQVPRALRQQVVADRREAAGQDGQRDQELLEHAHQAQAPRPRHRPADPPPARRRRRHRQRHGTAALPARGAEPTRRRRRRRCSRPSPPPAPPAAAGPFRGDLELAGGLQPQQRRRAAVRHSTTTTGDNSSSAAAAAPRHRPEPVHQPGALRAAGGLPHQQATEAGTRGGDDDGSSRPHQCDGGGGVPVPQQPRVPAGRRLRLRRRRLHAAGAMGSEFSTGGGTLLQRAIECKSPE